MVDTRRGDSATRRHGEILRVSVSPCLRVILFVALLSAFCLPPSAYGSSWTRQPSGTMAWLHAVYFVDQDHGWIAGGNGTLLSTVDGGVTWNKISLTTKDSLIDVYFSDSTHGWLLAQRDVFKLKSNEPSSYLLNTDDGGITWQRIFLNTADVNTRFTRMVFKDPEHGWMFGETGTIFSTSDGGTHWMPRHSATRHLLLGGAFANNHSGLVVGAGATIMQSDDGAAWLLNGPGIGEGDRLNAISLVGSFAWAVGNGGQIIASANGGHSWSRQRSNVAADLLDVRFIDTREGWVVGADGAVLHTGDGGLHWAAEQIGSSRGLERLFIIDRNHIWAVGFGGTILRFGETNAPRLK